MSGQRSIFYRLSHVNYWPEVDSRHLYGHRSCHNFLIISFCFIVDYQTEVVHSNKSGMYHRPVGNAKLVPVHRVTVCEVLCDILLVVAYKLCYEFKMASIFGDLFGFKRCPMLTSISSSLMSSSPSICVR